MRVTNLEELKAEFAKLGYGYKTKDVDRLNKRLIKEKCDVSFLRDLVLDRQEFHRTFFQVSMGQLKDNNEKLDFIEANFDKLNDWWHVDQLSQFVDQKMDFDVAYKRAQKYVDNEMAFARRWGYVIFMPALVKRSEAFEKLVNLLKDDDEYYVVMAQAWLISYMAIYHTEKTLEYLSACPLKYNIVGKAIQKICDSYRVSEEDKMRFKKVRTLYK